MYTDDMLAIKGTLKGTAMAKQGDGTQRIKFDLPPDYIRAIHVKAALEGVYPRDLIMRMLENFLTKELAEVRELMGITAQDTDAAKKRKRGKS